MFYFVFVTLSWNSFWGHSKVADNDFNSSKGKFLKMTAVELYNRRFSLRGLTSSKNVFLWKIHSFTPIWFWNFAWILGTRTLKYCFSFRVKVWVHVLLITSILPHKIIEWALYKCKAGKNTLFLEYS